MRASGERRSIAPESQLESLVGGLTPMVIANLQAEKEQLREQLSKAPRKA